MKINNFFAELKRRNVYKVAVAYAVVSWLVIQIGSTVLPTFHAPEWVEQVLVVFVVLGFPIALVLAWAFEITPEGVKLESEVPPNESITRQTGRKIVGLTIVAAVIAAALFVFERFQPRLTSLSVPATSANVIPEKSIAVLPFDNLSDEKQNAYFAEGVQDEILTRLAKVADLKVISRTSTQHFKSSPENLPEIARQLGVANILEGSVQRQPHEVRVNVQLIKAATDAHLWAEIYDRKLTDIFAVESDIAKTIADTLQAKLTGSEKRLLARKPTTNPEAYELYLKGRFFWNKRTAPDLRKSIDYFNQAIAKDPDYALAYAVVAQAWLLLPPYGGGAPSDCMVPAESAIKKALALDETSSDAHDALGFLRDSYQFNLAAAEKEFQRAIQLNPNDATAYHWYASDELAAWGDSAGEIAGMKRALELDPLSLIINTNLGAAFLHAGKFDEAITQFRKTLDMDGSFYFARWALGMALERQGRFREAMAEYQKAISLGSDDPAALALSGHLDGELGRKDEAAKVLEQLEEISKSHYIDPYYFALVYLGLGNRDQALSALEKSYEEHNGNNMIYIRIEPFLDPLRGDPRFEALADKIVPLREFRGKK